MRRARRRTFFDPDDKYIWSLVVDRDGNVFAGTGDKGTVYKITPDGKGAKFFASKTAHAVSLAFDQNRQLLVGTGAPGRVFRVDAAGKGFLLLDTTYQEIHAIRVDPKGVIYAAAQSGRAQGGDSLPETADDAAAGDALDPERLHRDHLDHRRRCRRVAVRRRLVVRRASQHHDRRRVSRAARWTLG